MAIVEERKHGVVKGPHSDRLCAIKRQIFFLAYHVGSR